MIETLISIVFCLSSALTVLILLLPSQYQPEQAEFPPISDDEERCKTSVQILVLGDIGRSPRMQYHALSIAKHGGEVVIIGYNDCLSVEVSRIYNKAVPVAFGSASVVCFLRQTRLIIDWHNFGYSILALKLGQTHPLVKMSIWYEKVFCRSASAHLCVTNAMRSVLKKDFNLQAPVLPLHDRPASHLNPILDPNARTEFLTTLPETKEFLSSLKAGSLRVLVSSTSWTADEDFSVLIDALLRYSELATTSQPHLPEVLAIITGKGPQKEMYLEQIAALEKSSKLQKVTIRTAWLSVPEYARLLASASLGVSLHTSSSGVDLPMKVVDMFGAGLPVVGWDRFEAWPELVTEGVNGLGFGSSEELAEHLVDLFGENDKLESLRLGAQKESSRRWDDEWNPIAGSLIGLT
ncbi:unnamed protein product [Penicillium glandicola]